MTTITIKTVPPIGYAFTGEFRRPMLGEWYDCNCRAVQCEASGTNRALILVAEKWEAHLGDRCFIPRIDKRGVFAPKPINFHEGHGPLKNWCRPTREMSMELCSKLNEVQYGKRIGSTP